MQTLRPKDTDLGERWGVLLSDLKFRSEIEMDLPKEIGGGVLTLLFLCLFCGCVGKIAEMPWEPTREEFACLIPTALWNFLVLFQNIKQCIPIQLLKNCCPGGSPSAANGTLKRRTMAADPVSQLLDAAGADVEMAPSSRDYLSPTKAVIRSALIPPSETPSRSRPTLNEADDLEEPPGSKRGKSRGSRGGGRGSSRGDGRGSSRGEGRGGGRGRGGAKRGRGGISVTVEAAL